MADKSKKQEIRFYLVPIILRRVYASDNHKRSCPFYAFGQDCSKVVVDNKRVAVIVTRLVQAKQTKDVFGTFQKRG